MRFTPITLFSADGNFTEPCVVARGTECTSGSFYAGPVKWDWFDYTGSGAFTGSILQSQFIIETGSTSRAVILTVGGGGGGAADDNGGGGGAGGVGLWEGITLEPNTYSVGVGGGGGGVRASETAPVSDNGNDGQDSWFLGGIYTGSGLVSAGGEGGFGQVGVNVDGGRSGENYGDSFTNGNLSGATGVATGWGGAGARTAVTSSDAFGYGFFIQYARQEATIPPLSENIVLALGGGGEGQTPSQPPVEVGSFGGGSYRAGLYPPGDAEANTGGGGGAGLAFKNTAPFEDTYWSSNGGSGRVIVFVPTNLCSSSLYTTPAVDKAGLTQWIDFQNGRTFGKNFTGYVFEDIIRPQQNMFPNGTINPSNSGSFLGTQLQYTSSFGIVDTNFFPSSSRYPIDEYIGLEGISQAGVISSETPFFNLANDFSLEWCGYQISTAGTSDDNQIFGIITGSGDPDDAVSPFFPNLSMRLKKDGTDTVVNLFKEFEPVSSTASLDIDVTRTDDYPTQYVITYDSASREVNLYNNSIHLVSMSNVEFPSQYDFQWASFMDDQPNEVLHSELRLYNRVISTGSMLQNLEASFSGSYVPFITCDDGKEYRFTAGGGGGTATYTLCNALTSSSEVLSAGEIIYVCTEDGSSVGITGAGSQIQLIGDCIF